MTPRDPLQSCQPKVESLPERLRVGSCRYAHETQDDAAKRRIATDLEAAEHIENLESDCLRLHKDAVDRWEFLKEIELISDNCVNAERYGAEEALDDLQAIRRVIKRAALQPKPADETGGS